MVKKMTINMTIEELVYHKEDKMSRGENLAVSRILYIVVFLIVMLFLCPMQATAKYQEIYFLPDVVNKSIGSSFSMSVMYNVSDNDNTLSGVGIRIHYDSTKLTYLNTTNLASLNISSPFEKAEDPKNTDRDANTDRMIIIAWADTGQGKWPNETLPFKLADLNFQVNTGISSSNTRINTGFTSVAAGYYGDPGNATINITTKPTVAWTTTSQSVSESIGSLDLTVELSIVSTEHDITIPISLAGTAEPVTDFNIATDSIFIPAGDDSATISISIVDDFIIEDDETIEIKLGSPDNALSDIPDTIIVTIEQEDEGPFSTPILKSSKSVVFFGDNFTINDEPAEIGDEIGVFDPDGILCGRAIVENEGWYVLTVYGDDETTELDEGAEVNDVLTIKIWDVSSQSESTVSNSMLVNEAVFDNVIPASPSLPPLWTGNLDQWGLNIHLSSSQKIPLHDGWNLFSFSVNKVYYDSVTIPSLATLPNVTYEKVASLNDVLSSISGKYDLIRNFDENGSETYNPNLPAIVNKLHYLAVGYGYWIKMNAPGVLELNGPRAQPSDSLLLNDNWNLIGCWHTDLQYDSNTPPEIDMPEGVQATQVTSLKQVFLSIDGKYSIVRNFDSKGSETFNPLLPAIVNKLHYIGPGYGYWIKLNDSTLFNY